MTASSPVRTPRVTRALPSRISKTPGLYVAILVTWVVLLVAAGWAFLAPLDDAVEGRSAPFVTTLLLVNALFIAYFWLNGVKDLVYVAYFYLRRSDIAARSVVAERPRSEHVPRVLLLYCTADDFSEDSLAACLEQDHPATLVILDDSRTDEMRGRVDRFAAARGAEVVRRPDRVGFKAGNLNNHLRGRTDYDFFVILDSDEIIPPRFVSRALDYFAASPDTGIVQANHIATRNRTPFMRLFARGVDSHWPTYQATKQVAGFMSLLGHGAMISRECYERAGGFPHVVAEDLCFAIEARSAGFYTRFAEDIVCEEEYPVDYLAFKKRHSKWTQGNLEFIRTYTGRILRSPMRWFEKLDIVLFTYNLPLTAFFALYVVLNLIAFPLLGAEPDYPAWLLVPTVIFLFSPMLNDIVYHRRVRLDRLAWYLVHSFVLYGSMFFVSLYASLRGMLGAKATFVVTPKDATRVGWREAVWLNRRELVFGASLIGIASVTTHSVLPVLLIAVPSLLSVHLTLLGNRPALPMTASVPVTG